MKRYAMIAILISACGTDDKPAPSCQQAFAHYYGVGCTFVDLSTNQPIPQGTITSECQSLAGAAPAQCQDELDDWLTCINDVKTCSTGDCSQQQMTLLRCR